MVTFDLATTTSTFRQLLATLDATIALGESARHAGFQALEPDLIQVAAALEAAGSRFDLAELRLKESLLCLGLGHREHAFSAAHQAWILLERRSSGSMQALVLTQLAATYEARGDLRAALRAVRRAEALVVAECGDDLPEVLLVRAQLARLLERSGRDPEPVLLRLEQTLEGLRRRVRDADQGARFERLCAVANATVSPTWATTWQAGWQNL